MKPCSGPLAGEPPTGEPDAGDPPVRFGGRGVTIQCDVPTPINKDGENYFFRKLLDSKANQETFPDGFKGVARLLRIADDIEFRNQVLERGKFVFRF
jgi:hypothetical protein